MVDSFALCIVHKYNKISGNRLNNATAEIHNFITKYMYEDYNMVIYVQILTSGAGTKISHSNPINIMVDEKINPVPIGPTTILVQ